MTLTSKIPSEESASQDVEKLSQGSKKQPETEEPSGVMRWLVVLACFIYNITCWGANSSYAIYIEQYINNGTFEGGNELHFSAIGGIAFGAGLLFAPIITWLYRRFSVQAVIAIGIVFQAVAFMLAAYSKKLWQLYLTQGVLLSFGLAFMFIPSITLIPFWFYKQRALAMGIATSGSGIGGIAFNLGMQRMIQVRSVKWALIVQFIVCFVLNCIALVFTRTRESTGSKNAVNRIQLFDKQLFSNIGFWLLMGWVSFTMLGYVVVLYTLSAFTVGLGYSARQGSYVSCMISVGWTVGRPMVGYLSDRFGVLSVGTIVHLVLALLCWAMWIPCSNLATAIAFGLLQGIFMGTIWATVGSTVARVVGLKKMSVTFSFVWIFVAAFGMVSPIIGLKLSSEGSDGSDYVNTAIFSGFGYFGGALCQWLLRGYIIARDKLIRSEKVENDANELHYQTKPVEVFKSLFQVTNLPRKV
ncbi:LANO_0H25092g1_1 [Lachancea nothofagi CBS 11611]|uniref:LANO_0H25092g1_1 n=1 Tax=Lachancea nothofagi CBS 11611 TaxID=1266666 RepID=A0A1G4KNV6_9SACH|nr:LANO_0H25092g1_1 [Lachancea nothofagi CBS 11611]